VVARIEARMLLLRHLAVALLPPLLAGAAADVL
jgi:hypothetical protein